MVWKRERTRRTHIRGLRYMMKVWNEFWNTSPVDVDKVFDKEQLDNHAQACKKHLTYSDLFNW